MNIILDVMGENGPEPIVHGAIEALLRLPDKDFQIILVGDERAIKSILDSDKYRSKSVRIRKRIQIVHANSVVGMKDSPESVDNDKIDSSISVGMNLVRDGKAEAFVSPGNTGAVITCASSRLGLLPGILLRPAIITLMPTLHGQSILLDSGATADCRPRHLLQYAIMGIAYAKRVLGISNPSTGILSNGGENCKGNKLVRPALEVISKFVSGVRYVEGFNIPAGTTDVVVCDGFVGNIVLKYTEGLFSAVKSLLSIIPRWMKMLASIGAIGLLVPSVLILCFEPTWFLVIYIPVWIIFFLTLLPIVKFLKSRFDYREHGGAPLLGVQGTVIIAHGRSPWRAIMNAIKQARLVSQSGINKEIVDAIKEVNGS